MKINGGINMKNETGGGGRWTSKRGKKSTLFNVLAGDMISIVKGYSRCNA